MNKKKKWKSLYQISLEYILEVLKAHNGNRTQTAKAIKISLRGLRDKLIEAKQLGYEITLPENYSDDLLEYYRELGKKSRAKK